MKREIQLHNINTGDKTGIDLHHGNPFFMWNDVSVDYRKVEVPYTFLEKIMPRNNFCMNKMLYCVHAENLQFVFGAYCDHKAYLYICNIEQQ